MSKAGSKFVEDEAVLLAGKVALAGSLVAPLDTASFIANQCAFDHAPDSLAAPDSPLTPSSAGA